LGVEDWAEIRRLRRAEGMPIKAIARVVGVSKNQGPGVLSIRHDSSGSIRAAAQR